MRVSRYPVRRAGMALLMALVDCGVQAVKKDSSWKELKEFLAFAKQNPGKATVGNAGMGSVK